MSTSLRFACPACGHKLKALVEQVGQKGRCTRCGAPFVVPRPTVDPAAGGDGPPSPILFPKRTRRSNDEGEDEVDLTPMIDVVFQLLIFFMVTAAFGQQKAIELPPTQASETAAEAATLEELEQDDDFTILRIERDGSLWIDDIQVTSEPDLFSKLRAARQPREGRRGAQKLLVVAHGEARHERVVQALDAGAHVGMDEVRLSTVEDD